MTDHIVSTSTDFLDLFDGDTLTVTTTGEILANSLSATASYIYGSVTVTNAGRIFGSAQGIISISGDMSSLTLTNEATGTIFGGDVGIEMDDSLASEITNHGSISGGSGVVFRGSSGAITFTNTATGTLEATDPVGHAFLGAAGAVTFTNAGTITGQVLLSSTGDTFDGTGGTVSGTVFGLDGDDSLTGGSANDFLNGDEGNDRLMGGEGADTIDGGEGHDDIGGGAGNDSLTGDVGNDTVSGRSGVDYMRGGDGHDVLTGGSGNDNIIGDAGNDRLDGGADDDVLQGGRDRDNLLGQDGADILYGGEGIDTLQGGDGNDLLFGGQERDILIGGGGSDRFVFILDDTNPGLFSSLASGVDTIRDFQQGADLIHLRDWFSDTLDLTFQGEDGAFAGMGQGSISFTHHNSRTTTVLIDMNGDAVEDARIYLAQNIDLTVADFVL